MPLIEIKKENFFNNLDIIAQKTKSKDKIALVLKDNAYGHSLELIAQLAQEYGVTKAVVRNSQEAHQIASYFPYILVLGDIPKTNNTPFHYTINSLEAIEKFPNNTKVELKVDTGMHRNGIAMDELEEAFFLIDKQKLQLKAVFTHHRSADELTSEWFWQNKNFEKVQQEALTLAKRYNIKTLHFHKDNSASLFRTHNFTLSMARVGIAAYGYLETPFCNEVALQPVLQLKAKKIATQKLPKNSRVGYGGSGMLHNDSYVSTYDIGYGDGFFRALSNDFVTSDGAKIVGRISMDSSSFYTTQKELLIFDNAKQIAKKLNTISYEVLTALKENIPRVVV
jgi:alanine racemase